MTRIALTLSLLISLTACGQPDIVVSTPPPPQEWLQCQAAPERPELAPLTTYAKPEVDTRDAIIARYIIALRSAYFDCANNLAKVRQYYREVGE